MWITKEKFMHHSVVIHSTPDFPRKLKVSHSTLIRADPLRVYLALTTAEGDDAWFATGANVNARPGREIHFRWVNWGPGHSSTQATGLVLEAIPGSRFIFQCHPDLTDYATTVEINLAPIEGGTIVRP